MNLYSHLGLMQMMSAGLDSRESARRREQQLWHKSEARELRKRRGRELAQRARTVVSVRSWRECRELPRQIDGLDLREPVR